MRYRLLGRSGLRVSEVALGTMTFGAEWGWGADERESRRMFHRFAERGGNFVDTASNYTEGASERIIGGCLKGNRDRFVVATKYTLTSDRQDPNAGGNQRKNLVRSLDSSLKRLGTDYVDMLWLHMWDGMTPLAEVMRALDDAVRAGKVHYVGFSDTPAWVVSRAVELAERHGWVFPAAVQLPYSVLDRSVERESLPMAATLGLAAVAWGVLEGGLLTGKHLGEDGGDTAPSRLDPEGLSERARAAARAVVNIARDVGVHPAQLAVAWVLANPSGATVIPILGARSQAQLDQQVDAIDLRLDAATCQRLSALGDLDLGFPRGFLESDHVRGLIFGDTYDAIVPA